MNKEFPFGKNLTDNIINDDLIFQWVGYMSDEIYFQQYQRLLPKWFLQERKEEERKLLEILLEKGRKAAFLPEINRKVRLRNSKMQTSTKPKI